MAHLESKALGGYYPFPMHLIGMVGQLIDANGIQERFTDYNGRPSNYGAYSFLDPCAGDGEAIIALARELMADLGLERHRGPKTILYANELEEERADNLARALHQIDSNRYSANRAQQGDAFRIRFKGNGASVMLLNPPYDQSKQYGREEHRWLMRWTEALNPGAGILAYVVPHYALEVSATFIAKHYSHVFCYRFPGDDFEAFKQVVLIGVRSAQAQSL